MQQTVQTVHGYFVFRDRWEARIRSVIRNWERSVQNPDERGVQEHLLGILLQNRWQEPNQLAVFVEKVQRNLLWRDQLVLSFGTGSFNWWGYQGNREDGTVDWRVGVCEVLERLAG